MDLGFLVLQSDVIPAQTVLFLIVAADFLRMDSGEGLNDQRDQNRSSQGDGSGDQFLEFFRAEDLRVFDFCFRAAHTFCNGKFVVGEVFPFPGEAKELNNGAPVIGAGARFNFEIVEPARDEISGKEPVMKIFFEIFRIHRQ